MSCAEDLQAQAGMFKKNATTLKKQMWWKQFRVRDPSCRLMIGCD